MHKTPRLLSIKVHAIIVETVRKGLPLKMAAARAEIPPKLLYNWLSDGQDDADEWAANVEMSREGEIIQSSALQRLYTDVTKAAADFAMDRYELLDQQAKSGSMSAATWPLEKLFPEIYSKKIVTEHTGTIERNINIQDKQLSDMDTDHRSKVIDLLIKQKEVKSISGSN